MFYIFYSWGWTLDLLTRHGKALPKLSKLFQILHIGYKQFLRKEKENEASNPGKIEQKTLET